MLSRAHRFHGLHALDFVYKRGQTVRGQAVTLKFVKNNRQEQFRVAVVVSKKVSKSAVQRNRIRRRVFEAARAELGNLSEPYDLVFMIYSADVATIEAAQLQKQMKALLHKAAVVLY
jgi:ribonuclease P protein component